MPSAWTCLSMAFGYKAFCNYYFFVIGALCCAIAALPIASGKQRQETGA